MVNSSPASLYIGIDFGTSGCRGAVINSVGEQIAFERIEIESPHKQGSHIFQAPDLWRQTLYELVAKLGTHVEMREVVALCINGTSGTVLLCDENGHELTNALMYNDASATEAAAEIAKIAPTSSGALGVSSGLAKLIQLGRDNHSPSNRLAATQADWLAALCTGKIGTCDKNNALKLGYDLINDTWPDWVKQFLAPLNITLPKVVSPGDYLAPVSHDFASTTGLSTHTKVFAGTTDSIAAFIATGVNRSGEAVTSLGSTLVIKLLSAAPIFEPNYGVYSHKLGDMWLVGGASNAGCAILKDYFTQSQLDELTRQLTPDTPTRLDYYPLSQKGERFPIADPELAPCLEPRPDNEAVFFQAILEGLTQIELQAYKKLEELGAPYPTRIVSCGGGSQNDAWTKIRANTLKTKVETAFHSEAAYGSALLAKQGY